jgi:hypothetical protein
MIRHSHHLTEDIASSGRPAIDVRGRSAGEDGHHHRSGSRTGVLVAAGVVVAIIAAAAVFALKNDNVRETVAGAAKVLPFKEPRVTVPTGTPITVTLSTSLSTGHSSAGDRFAANVTEAVTIGGRVAIPEGARIDGHVLVSEQPGKVKGRGRMQLAFEQVSFDGHSYSLGSRSAMFQSRSGADEDAAMIGGGAVTGGIIGGILGDGTGDAAKGAIIGGAAGTAVSLMTRGPQLEFPKGTRIRFTLDQPVEVRQSQPS